jgi:hypothetical protein
MYRRPMILDNGVRGLQRDPRRGDRIRDSSRAQLLGILMDASPVWASIPYLADERAAATAGHRREVAKKPAVGQATATPT